MQRPWGDARPQRLAQARFVRLDHALDWLVDSDRRVATRQHDVDLDAERVALVGQCLAEPVDADLAAASLAAPCMANMPSPELVRITRPVALARMIGQVAWVTQNAPRTWTSSMASSISAVWSSKRPLRMNPALFTHHQRHDLRTLGLSMHMLITDGGRVRSGALRSISARRCVIRQRPSSPLTSRRDTGRTQRSPARRRRRRHGGSTPPQVARSPSMVMIGSTVQCLWYERGARVCFSARRTSWRSPGGPSGALPTPGPSVSHRPSAVKHSAHPASSP